VIHSLLTPGVPTLHAYWRGRIRFLLNAGDIDAASRLADVLLDDVFPSRWS
jgi:hypothetical protein